MSETRGNEGGIKEIDTRASIRLLLADHLKVLYNTKMARSQKKRGDGTSSI